ncbi:cerebral cavernous malformations protein 2 homolog isoform X2 [Dreissena polymorpha]|uniref:Cerebral cavernous malformations 2 harmonin-homology domain-containing protein n=1 Tax=Dreissena polymorpha TaxID=45954 RepID=A0A9D4HE11_DREPO|nr:cerebral cavernous malformations protein 2 homolog isoform X2 [Dreissena polymorpha]KAH3831701.1 hypothetical protein DPMN_104971 [Dreissena polymorpha]
MWGSRASVNSLLESRRPLRHIALTTTGLDHEMTLLQDNPDHRVEFEIKYLGDIPGVPGHTDTTNRTEVLKIIDRGKKQGLVPLQLSTDQDAVLHLGTESIKITRRDGAEDELQHYKLHDIAQVCYVDEDGQHILAVTHGTPEIVNMTVLLCDSQEQAEGVHCLWGYCFQLVYEDAMIKLIEDTIDGTIEAFDPKTSTPGTGSTKSMYIGDPHPPPSVTPSDTSTQAEILHKYMWQLKTKLKIDELVQFSDMWKNWNFAKSKLLEFCESLYTLFGLERTYLLSGLLPFIPAKDVDIFNDFLQKHEISLPRHGHGTLSSLNGYPAFYTSSISDMSINSNTTMNDADLDSSDRDYNELDNMGKKFESIELSVGDTAQTYFPQAGSRNGKV